MNACSSYDVNVYAYGYSEEDPEEVLSGTVATKPTQSPLDRCGHSTFFISFIICERHKSFKAVFCSNDDSAEHNTSFAGLEPLLQEALCCGKKFEKKFK